MQQTLCQYVARMVVLASRRKTPVVFVYKGILITAYPGDGFTEQVYEVLGL